MPIKFKVTKRGQPGVIRDGKKKYYASQVIDDKLGLADLTASFKKISIVTGVKSACPFCMKWSMFQLTTSPKIPF